MKIPFPQKVVPKSGPVIRIPSADDAAFTEENFPVHETPPEYGQLPLDILENEKEILILAPIAGVDLENTEVVVNEDVLTIQGKRQLQDEASLLKGRTYYLQECFWGDFSRSVILPMDADTQNLEATEKDHILYIRIPKRLNLQMRIIKIKSK